jgi:hypothetical protein
MTPYRSRHYVTVHQWAEIGQDGFRIVQVRKQAATHDLG